MYLGGLTKYINIGLKITIEGQTDIVNLGFQIAATVHTVQNEIKLLKALTQ